MGRPGITIRCLNGKMKQMKRLLVYYEFCASNAMLLLATDIASRGLDFPAVDWALQVDCPEDISQYIHRVGRTARYNNTGQAMILLLPNEKKGMLILLKENKIPISFVQINPNKKKHVTSALKALILKGVELKVMAERGLVSYVRSISIGLSEVPNLLQCF